ncbi:helix-turn-helix domain-containing protein [Nocardia takedensis]|uniref:helix-turn-helix domain-containing protein n=1 Tax=Nocardia TaxID=1817 RepID=UPI0024573DCD|nr:MULTISPECIES: helix-turn-helix domain-containing protein [Nocardia]
MTRDPAKRRSSRSRHALPPRVPTLGNTCRRIRDERGYTRDYAAAMLRISRSYLSDIERGRRNPSPELLELIIVGYRLDSALARHVRELRLAAVNLEPTAVLARCVTDNALLMAHLRDLNARGDLAAYIDPVWNVLACNDLFREALPGLERTGSVPVWIFSDDSKPILTDRPFELDYTAAAIRAITGRYRNTEQVRALFRYLGPNVEFRTSWSDDVRAAYGRDPSALMYAIHPVTGLPASYSLTISNQSESVLLLILSPKPSPDSITNREADG